jgi:hypothetical protein
MQQYLYNLIKRLKKYSKALDKIEVFAEKPWVYIDKNNNHHEYLFMYDKRLIMSLNGVVKIGKWELLPNDKLLIDRVSDQVMLENKFIDDALMVLHKSGTDEFPFTLINENKIPDLDAVKYLESLHNKRLLESNQIPPGHFVLNKSGSIIGDDLSVGSKLYSPKKNIYSGTYPVAHNQKLSAVVKKNIVIEVFRHKSFKLSNNNVIKIKTDEYGCLMKGCQIIDFDPSIVVPNQYVDINDNTGQQFKILVNHEGNILKAIDVEFSRQIKQLIAAVSIFIILLVLIIIFRLP